MKAANEENGRAGAQPYRENLNRTLDLVLYLSLFTNDIVPETLLLGVVAKKS